MSRVSILVSIFAFAYTADVIAQIEPKMVPIPEGCAEVGTLLMDPQSSPLREVCLGHFLISQYEITFLEYDIFTNETARAARNDVGFGRDNRPVIDVNWFDAVAYAEWLSDKTGKRYRLPTDAEWEYVAKLNTEFGFNYSWGTEYEHARANCRNCGSEWDARMTAPVGSFEPSLLGVYDMHGNVWEWTSDCYFEDDPKDESGIHCQIGVVRGGSWDVGADDLVFWKRTQQNSKRPTQDIGFRLVMDP
ncbi:MAG: SUMF1/EgtB/PvdO family nonheme iron enzyme [Gammaproteobacteria bacterium]|nr:SUMF1/EgtB/PvdO family nonheme iron enzyme [Gammaproteobacteria bacterium]